MTITQDLQNYFGGGAATRLGEAAGLAPQAAAHTLAAELPRQLGALAAHAGTPEGRAQVQEAVDNLPVFGPVTEVLDDPDGAGHLEQAGALLAPVLLGESAPTGEAGEVRLLHMVLPLLLSRLGQQEDMTQAFYGMGTAPLNLSGLSAAGAVAAVTGAQRKVGPVPGLDSVPGEPSLPGADLLAGVTPALTSVPDPLVEAAPSPTSAVSFTKAASPEPVPAHVSAPESVVPEPAVAGAAGALGTAGLLELIRAQFSGRAADQIGRAGGFSAGTSSRAVAGALPVVLNAVSGKGSSPSGAAELLRQGGGFDRLTTPEGGLNTALLGDSAEMARLEGQGRGLLGGLFGNFEAMTGRLGTALGGSGASAGRLLALLTPLVLALVARHAQARSLDAASLSTELIALGPQLPGLIPSGMGGLTALLGAATLAGGAAAGGTRPPEVIARAAPASGPTRVAAPTPPAPPASIAPPPASPVSEKRRAFPWWLIPLLLLLLLGGCWVVNRNNNAAQTGTGSATTSAAGSGIVVTSPASGTDLPAQAFTMSGTATAGQSLRIEDQGQEVGTATADASGNWSAELPAPTPGEHTYSVIGGEGVRSEFKVNVTGDGDTSGTGTTSDTGSAAAGTEAETVPADTASGSGTTTDTGAADATSPATAGNAGTDTTGVAGAAASAAAGTAETPEGAVAFGQPANGAEVSAAGLTLSGTGPAGQSYEVLEDGTSIGNVAVGADGTWTLAVPAATPGAKTYVLRGADGQEAASLPLTVTANAAATGAAAGATCTEALTVSLKDGETVSVPYRFGGVGSGEGYTVTVKRGERVIGTRTVTLGEGCAWSYTSNPGGRSGSESRVTYEVRPRGTAVSQAAEATLTLTVRN
jgi:hypothetical protein